ncbi:MAG: ATP-binding protein [Candidatus Cryosericum sp.]
MKELQTTVAEQWEVTSTSTWHTVRSLLRSTLVIAAYLCTFVVLDLISHQFEEIRGTVAWYPPTGLTYALLLVFGEKFAPGVTIALLISNVFIYRMPQPLYLMVLWALIISSIYGAAAAFLHRRVHFDWQLHKTRDVSWLVVTAVCVSALLAILSVGGSALSSDMPRNEVLRAMFIWWIGETVGVLTITPFLLIHVMPRLKPHAAEQLARPPTRRSLPHPAFSVIGQAFSIVLVFYWVFGSSGPTEFRPMYLIILPLIWIALDRGFRGVTTGIVLMNFGVMLALWLFHFDVARLGELQLLAIVNCIVGLLMGTTVTERRQAEEALLKERDEWENTFESLTDAVTIHDKNYDIIRANAAARQMLGLPLADGLVNAKCFLCYHGTEKPPEGCPSCKSLQTQKPSISEFFEPHLNKYLEIRAIPRFDSDHQCVGLVHVVRDITERKRAESELRESEEYARTLVDSMNTGIVMIDAETHVIVNANPAAITMLHSTKKSILGAMCHTFICPAEQGKCPVSDLGQTVDSSQRVLLSPRGDRIPVIKSVFPIILHDHNYLLETFVDISDRVRAEAEKDVMQAQLRQSQKMETIGQLAGGVAHDFNNLLTGILGNITLMRSSLPSTDPLLENLNATESAARQAATLTKGLLTFSRSAVVLPVSTKITAALDVSLALLKQSLPSTMTIVRDDDRPAWNVLLDQTQMTQILLNLVVNARDAMQGKGVLTVRTRNMAVDAPYASEHSYARPGEFVHLSVTDTGPGMSSNVMQHLFEPFYTTKPAGSGTGLGLSIVYGAVKQAGGWIIAESAEGAGATFNIYLPRCLEGPSESFTSGPVLVHGVGETILVVEDEPIVSAVAQTLLRRSGYTVLTALDGASALSALHEHLTDIRIILLDMTMPGMTTDDIVPAIRALTPTVPVLLTSGNASSDTVKHMLDAGMVQGFLAKPYEPNQLADSVQALLHQR